MEDTQVTFTAAPAALKERFPVKASVNSSLSGEHRFYLVLMNENTRKLEDVGKEEGLQSEEKIDIVKVEEDKSVEGFLPCGNRRG